MVKGKYQTFWPRFWAGWIDVLVFVPILYLDKWFYGQGYSVEVTFIYYICVRLSFCIYSVVMHGYFGQTLGKMLTGVKVFSISGGNLGFKRACLRDSVIILTTIIWLVLEAPEILGGVSALESDMEGDTFNFLEYAELSWFLAEVLTMLTNNKRRAIHDFIAGSVVQRL